MAEYAAGDMDGVPPHGPEGQPRLVRYDKDGRDVSEIWYNEGYLHGGRGYSSGVVGLRYSPARPGTEPCRADAVRRSRLAGTGRRSASRARQSPFSIHSSYTC